MERIQLSANLTNMNQAGQGYTHYNLCSFWSMIQILGL